MRDQKMINFRVGLFVLIAIGLSIFIILTLSGDQKFFEKSYTLETSFKNTSGIIKGAAVRLSGVRIGAVTGLDFAKKPVGDKVINVTMKINKEGISRLNPDSKATIRTEGLLGDKFIEVLPGEKAPLTDPPDVTRIESKSPMEMAELIDQSGDLLTNIISISESLDQIVKAFGKKENIKHINETIASLKASSETLQKSLESIESGNGILSTMIYGPKDKSGTTIDENTLVKLNKLINEINNGDGSLHALIYDDKLSKEIDDTLSNLRDATAKLNGEDGVMTELQVTMGNFREISEMIRGGEGTIGGLLIDPSIYDSLKGVLGEAERSKFVRAAVRYLVDQEKANNAELNGVGSESAPN